MSANAPATDADVDVVVFGSGAAGLVAALTAAVHGQRVLLCEKDTVLGGTTATSGGTCWVPCSRQAVARAIPDTPVRAASYLDREIGVPDTDGRRRAFLDAAPRAFAFVEANSALTFALPDPYPDYHPGQDGASTGGRTLQPLPFDGRRLGKDFALLRRPNRGHMVFGGLMVSRPEAKLLVRPFASRHAFAFATRSLARFLIDRVRYSRGTRLLLGSALVAALLHSLRERGVAIWTEAPLVSLVRDGNRIGGAIVRHRGKQVRVRARRAVVVATGGISSSAELRRTLAPRQPADWALSTPCATGDGLAAARDVGAAIAAADDVGLFLMPASIMQDPHGGRYAFPHVVADRARPGLIAVNAAGQRFVNEADSYHDFVLAMYRDAPPARAYLVCDHRSLRRYGLGLIRPVWQWRRYYERAGYLVTADTLEALAARIGVDPTALSRTVRRYNDDAITGVDMEFGKGSTALNRFNGDQSAKPNPCLAPIATAPYHAVAVVPAAVGASVGIATDSHSRVLDSDDRPIEGLYACGNDQGSIMRGAYPGPGITLGPAVTSGYCAMVHACRDAACK